VAAVRRVIYSPPASFIDWLCERLAQVGASGTYCEQVRVDFWARVVREEIQVRA
jgi:hypothetical protein